MLHRAIDPAGRRSRARNVFTDETELSHIAGCRCCSGGGASVVIETSPTTNSTQSAGLSARQVSSTTTKRDIIPPGLTRFEGNELQPQPDIEVLSDKVISVLAQNPNPFTLNGTNTYLVGTGKKRLLIDTGEGGIKGDKYLPILRDAMAQHGIEGLDGIVVTHLHFDHVGGTKDIMTEFGECNVYKFPTNPKEQKVRDRMIRGAIKANNGQVSANIQASPYYTNWLFDKVPSVPLVHGEVISTEGATLRVYHTPGHASDHVALMLEEEQRLFTGDHVLGWGSTWVQYLKDYMESLYLMQRLNPISLYPSHGPFIEDGKAKLAQYVKHRQDREDALMDVLWEHRENMATAAASVSESRSDLFIGNGMLSRDLVREVYAGGNDMQMDSLNKAEENILKILIKLRAEAKVVSVEPTGDQRDTLLNESNNGERSPTVPKEDYLMVWYINESYAKSVLREDALSSLYADDGSKHSNISRM